MQQNTQPTPNPQPSVTPAPLTAAQAYEKLGALLREVPEAANQPLYLCGEGFSFHTWEILASKDSTNADVICFDSEIPE